MTHLISPSSFIVEDYAPGLTVDFREPAPTSDLQQRRAGFDPGAWRGLSLEQQLQRADALCQELGISASGSDLTSSLARFSSAPTLAGALRDVAARLRLPGSDDPLAQIVALLERTGVLQPAPHRPFRLWCHTPGGQSLLEDGGTHLGYVLDGEGLALELASGHRYPLHPGCYFSAPGQAVVTGHGRVELLTSFGHQGTFSLGGPLEPWGRLRYIDGCTDTMLIPPVRLGDPCLNALYFPPQTHQTQHTHPSLRAGVVVSGGGVCRTPHGDHELSPGKVFLLPAETWHAFHTGDAPAGQRSALTVIAFHPDSDFGPTDDDHPMLNRTYFEMLHRLRSAERTCGTG